MTGGRHRVLVVGVGSIGERHVRCFLATGRCEVSICETNPSLRQAMAERYGLREVYDSTAAALAAQPTAVVIATPAPSHVALAFEAADAGVHVLIEKPLSTRLGDVDRLIEAVEARQLVAGVAYVQRAYPALANMRAALQSGRFGEPVELVAVCGQNFPFYRPAYRQTYYADRAMGGGAVQDALTHVINSAEWLIGPIDRVVADAAHQVLPDVEVEDTVHVLARHGRVLASYALNQYQAPNEVTVTVTCTGGSVRFETHAQRWRWMTEPGGPWNDEPAEPLDRDGPFIRQAEAFLDALEGRTAPVCSLPEGVQTLRVNLAILTSVLTGRWQDIATVEDAVFT